jgi:hypothetical protein
MKELDVAFCVCHLEDAMTNMMVPERKAMLNKETKNIKKKIHLKKFIKVCPASGAYYPDLTYPIVKSVTPTGPPQFNKSV